MKDTFEFLATATLVVVAIWSLRLMLKDQHAKGGDCGCGGGGKKAMRSEPPVTRALVPSPGVNLQNASGCGPKLGKKAIAPAVA